MTWKGKGVGKGEKEGWGGDNTWERGRGHSDMDWEVRSKTSNKIVVKIRNSTFISISPSYNLCLQNNDLVRVHCRAR